MSEPITCLVIIYNHNYEKNISVLNRIYSHRFSKIVHIMPFYRGDDPNVIGVYDNSFQFNGYIAQATEKLYANGSSRYFFIGDDVCLNPKINEHNLCEWLKLDQADSFINDIRLFRDSDVTSWNFGRLTYVNLASMTQDGSSEGWRFLPPIEKARTTFKEKGFDWTNGAHEAYYRILKRFVKIGPVCPCNPRFTRKAVFLHKLFSWLQRNYPGKCLYPAAWGYSDVLVVPRTQLLDFGFMNGVFASLRTFVEVAIPTSLILTSKRIKTTQDIGLHSEMGNGTLAERKNMIESYGGDYEKMIAGFPEDYIFVHPIKLSQWRNLP